jgi:hypothetical protein
MEIMKIKNKTFILLGDGNKTIGITCSNSVLLMTAVRMGWG